VNAVPRVLMAHNYYLQQGGEDFAFENEVQLLRSRGHQVETYARSNEELDATPRLAAAVEAFWSWRSWNELSHLVHATCPDVVHFHNTFPLISPSGVHAVKSLNVPVVVTLHNYRLTCAAATHFRAGHVCLDCVGKLVPWPAVAHNCYRQDRGASAVVAGLQVGSRMVRTWSHKVDALIVLSEWMRGVLEAGGLPHEKLHIKANFLPDPGMGKEGRERALFVGRLTSEKGVDTLLSGWRRLSDIPLDIVGSGPLEKTIRKMVVEQGLEHVRVLGQITHEEVIAVMKRARLLIVPSIAFEGLPMTIIEGFACGTPVVASAIGAPWEMVGQHAGAVFKTGDPDDLRRVVRTLWTDDGRLERMRQFGRREYERVYSPDRNYHRLTEIYEAVLT